jgi:hypothetical protein
MGENKTLDGVTLYIDHIKSEYNSLQQEYILIKTDIMNCLPRILYIQERCQNIINTLNKLKSISKENIKKYYLAEGPCVLNFEN